MRLPVRLHTYLERLNAQFDRLIERLRTDRRWGYSVLAVAIASHLSELSFVSIVLLGEVRRSAGMHMDDPRDEFLILRTLQEPYVRPRGPCDVKGA